MMPEVHTTSIAEAVIGKPNIHRLLQEINTVTVGIDCDRCNKPIIFTSCTVLKQSIDKIRKNRLVWAEDYRVVCEECKESIYADQREAWEATDAAREIRLAELRNMPYQEYLRSPEWQKRRKRHLKSTGYRCQVCNADNTVLDVHHRTYIRKGNEQYKDLIVLCRGCHGLFHREGRLAY